MSQKTMSAVADSPKDKYYGVWMIFFLLGLGTLLPWNFFMTATMYFTSRLKETTPMDASANQTEAAAEHRSILEEKFNNVMTLCAMMPLLLFTCLNSLLHTLVSQRLRVMGSLVIIMSVFMVTTVLVKVPLEPLPFFIITMVKIVIINSCGAVLQGSLFGMAALLSGSYTTPIMSGQGLAGTFAAFAMICAIASGSELHEAAFGYFITACVVVSLSLLSYVLLPRLVTIYLSVRRRKQMIRVQATRLQKPYLFRGNVWQKIKSIRLFFYFYYPIASVIVKAVTNKICSKRNCCRGKEVYFHGQASPLFHFQVFNTQQLSSWSGLFSSFLHWSGCFSHVSVISIVQCHTYSKFDMKFPLPVRTLARTAPRTCALAAASPTRLPPARLSIGADCPQNALTASRHRDEERTCLVCLCVNPAL
ncbi:equilibrative nucleoside transporter 1-like, partial [Solea senegalensis]